MLPARYDDGGILWRNHGATGIEASAGGCPGQQGQRHCRI
jgi:hypothetical protein